MAQKFIKRIAATQALRGKPRRFVGGVWFAGLH